MPIKSPSLILSAALAIAPAGCSNLQEPNTPSPRHDIEPLIRLSQSNDRERWLPAVERLGELADSDDHLRKQIWARASVNSLGQKFVEVVPGTFTMGPDVHRLVSANVAHTVVLTNGYFISATEVTNGQYMRLTGEDRAYPMSPDSDSPVVHVTWEEADRFCKALSETEGVVYRLPTEAEWEYACRAGSKTQFCFGDNVAELSLYGWHSGANGRASRVGLLKPNSLGIYDMHGNAFEWVSDWHSLTYYGRCASKGVVGDPTGPPSGWTHALRGGGWPARNRLACSSTARFPLPIFDRRPFSKDVGFRHVVGFRIVREMNR
ncbi:MAG: formylglycine-generating enzyme family protein [bacterium]|nr:formylglycine-generating enzyme family protein [bacterium]